MPGITGFADLTVYGAGIDSVVTFSGARIDVYGVAGLTESDFLFS